MDKEEEETEEDKNDMVGREEGQRNDHARRNGYCCLEILTKRPSTRGDTIT